MMTSTIAARFVDVKTNREYDLKPGKQIIASNNYSGPEENVDLKLICDNNITPFLVELSVKKQSARLTCIAGHCVANSIRIGPGGSMKLKNSAIVEFGEMECCVEMKFIIQQLDESQDKRTNEVGQMKRTKRKLPETPGIPAQPPSKPARKFSSNSQPTTPPKPPRRKAVSTSAIITYSEVTEIKRKISREVNMRERGDVREVSVKVANSVCYQLMLQPNCGDLITNKLIDDIKNITKIMEQHMLSQMEKFLAEYKDYSEIKATPECLLPADTPVIKHLLDTLIRSPSMQEDAKEVCSVVVEVLVIFSSSAQNRYIIIAHDGMGVVTTIMKVNTLQFCFELHCNCWKLLTMMMETVLDREGKLTSGVLEMSCSLAKQQLSKFDNNCPLVCAVTSYLVSAVRFCKISDEPTMTNLFTTLRDGDMLQHVMRVSTNVKQNEQFKQQCSKLATLLAPELSRFESLPKPSVATIESELESSGDITIFVHDSFKKDLDSFDSLKTSAFTGGMEQHKEMPPLPKDGRKSLRKSQSDSSIVWSKNSEPRRKESKVMEVFKNMHLLGQQEPAKSSGDTTEQQETTLADVTGQQEQKELSTEVDNPQEQITDVVNKKREMKLSSNQLEETEPSTNIFNQQEQTRSHTDTIDQQEQTKSHTHLTEEQEQTIPDMIGQQECTTSSLDVDQHEQTKSRLDATDLQEQEKSSTDMSDHQKQTKQRQMYMNNPYMRHTLKRQYKNKHDSSTYTTNSKHQSGSSDESDFSHMSEANKEFSEEQACIEDIMNDHENTVGVLTTRMDVVNTLVPLWHQGKSLQAAINAEASCFNEDDNDTALLSDLLSLFITYRSGWTLAVSLVFLRYFKQLLQSLSDPNYLQVMHDTLEMILERFADIILSCRRSTAKGLKLSAQHDRQQKEACYEELQEIQQLVTKELAKTRKKTADNGVQQEVEYYRKLQKLLEPFREPLKQHFRV